MFPVGFQLVGQLVSECVFIFQGSDLHVQRNVITGYVTRGKSFKESLIQQECAALHRLKSIPTRTITLGKPKYLDGVRKYISWPQIFL